MAPAQNLDITTQNSDNYSHKKFQGKRNYAHKKFGTRSSASTSLDAHHQHQQTTASLAQTLKKPCSDIFRPYALPDKTPRKRKHNELTTEPLEEVSTPMEFKRFAHSATLPTPSPTPSPSPPTAHDNSPYTSAPLHTPFMVNPYYRLQHYNFNAQTFALILQKQRTALSIGEMILKRQGNLNLYNLLGQ